MSKPLFSLLHPTKRLAGEVYLDACEAWAIRCDDRRRVEYIMCVDPEDYRRIVPLRSSWGCFQFVRNLGRPCAVDAWNTAAMHSTGEILITVADDYFPPEHWDTEIVNFLDRGDVYGHEWRGWEREFVLDVDNQEGSDWLLPFSFISRAYSERLGCLFWPEYFGMGADNDFTERARADGVVIDARHLKFSHPQFPADDPVYLWQHRPEAMKAYHEVFARRKQEGFPYPPPPEMMRNLRAPGTRAPEGVTA